MKSIVILVHGRSGGDKGCSRPQGLCLLGLFLEHAKQLPRIFCTSAHKRSIANTFTSLLTISSVDICLYSRDLYNSIIRSFLICRGIYVWSFQIISQYSFSSCNSSLEPFSLGLNYQLTTFCYYYYCSISTYLSTLAILASFSQLYLRLLLGIFLSNALYSSL